MQKLINLFCASLLMFCGQALAAEAPNQGVFQEVTGTVLVAVGTDKPVQASKGAALFNNATITTGAKSQAILRFIDNTVIVLSENSSFQIQKYNYDEKTPGAMAALFNITRGALRVVTGAVSQRNREAFRLTTPTATVGIRGTDFMVALVNPAFISVIQGAVATTNAAGTAVFSAGQLGVVSTSASLGVAIPASALPPSVAASFSSMGSLAVGGAAGASGAVGGAGSAGGAGGIGGAAALGGAAAAAGLAGALTGNSNPPGGTTTGTTTGTTR